VTIVVLLILAIVWAVVLVPPWLRNRSESRPSDSISSFRRQLSVLERTTPGAIPGATPLRRPPPAPVAPPAPYVHPAIARRQRAIAAKRLARKRRRDIFTGLLVLMVATLGLSFVPSLQVLRTVHLVLDVLFVAYVALLVRVQRVAAEREMKVHYLPGSVAAEPALLLRRSAN
jgi:hypothetical protein